MIAQMASNPSLYMSSLVFSMKSKKKKEEDNNPWLYPDTSPRLTSILAN